jgi:hypothetical protein
MKQTWRQYYAPKIAKIIEDNKGKSIKELKKILQEANPGQYGHMIKTWANEYMIQLGLSRRKGKGKNNNYHRPDENQANLF